MARSRNVEPGTHKGCHYISKKRPSLFVILSGSEESLPGQRFFALAQNDRPYLQISRCFLISQTYHKKYGKIAVVRIFAYFVRFVCWMPGNKETERIDHDERRNGKERPHPCSCSSEFQ